MLDNVSKLLECRLLVRLSMVVAVNKSLSESQHGFRHGRRAIQAIGEVLSMTDAAVSDPFQHRDLLLLVTLDVCNAFNTVPWVAIDEVVRQKGVPVYVISIYMKNKAVLVSDGDTQKEMEVFCGVPQGSFLRPALLNTFYDDFLRLRLLRAVRFIGFADNVALTVTPHTTEDLERTTNEMNKWWSRGRK